MKNIRDDQKKSCITLTCDEFKRAINIATNGLKYADVDEDGDFEIKDSNKAYDENRYVDDDVYTILGNYFDISIDSIHSDYADVPMIWICYVEV